MKITLLGELGPRVLDVPPTTTVRELKREIRQRCSFPERDPLFLQYRAAYLDDDKSLETLRVPEGATLIFTRRLGVWKE
jgi:hypothetical protein